MRKHALPRKRTVRGVRIARVLAFGACALASVDARAQLDARTWRPSTDADASLVLEPTNTAGSGRWNLGLWTQYEQVPTTIGIGPSNPSAMTYRGAEVSGGVERMAGIDFVAGLGLGSRFAIGLDVPVDIGSRAALGAMAITGKATLVSNDHDGVRRGFGLAALGALVLGTGDSSLDFSTGRPNGQLEFLGEFAVGIGAIRAEVGYSAPGSRVQHPASEFDAANAPPSETIRFEDTIPWAFGVVVRPKVFGEALDNGDRQLWEIAAHGSLPGGPSVAPFGLGAASASFLSPALLGFDDRVAFGHNRELFVLAGGEIGLDSAIGVPTFRAVVSMTWAPRSHDKDGDGVDDEKDQCPDLPEDRDGIQDADGCPEDDADGDSILDQDDACPLVPGVPSNDPKKNGCPGEVPAPPAPDAPEAPPTPPPVPIEEKTP
jgi:OOP family OmpA-OmpF porin